MKQKGDEKRIFERGPLQIIVRYTMQKKSEKGYMTNLSKGGALMYCYSPNPVQVNEAVSISFRLKNSPDNIRLKGQIVRVTPYDIDTNDYNYQLGIKFLNLKEKQEQTIENFVRRILKNIKQEGRLDQGR
jgi:c-di-GMP-binding flagellar brake protein YcgR